MAEGVKPRKLAVGALVRFAYRTVFGRLGLILELGWIMLLVMLAAQILPDLLLPDRHTSDTLQLDPLDYVQALISVLALTAFAVRWHQSILIGDPRRQPMSAFLRGWARFLAYGVLIYAVVGAILAAAVILVARMAGSAATEALVGLVGAIAAFLVALSVVRCGLVFPAAASGKPMGIGSAWRMMGGNTWRLVLASIVTTLPVTIVLTLLSAVLLSVLMATSGTDLTGPHPLGFTILAGLVTTMVDFVLVALGASLLSGAYRELIAWRGNGDTGNGNDQR